MKPHVRDLARLVQDTAPELEHIHRRDCPACDTAWDIAGQLAALWDPDDDIFGLPALRGVPGDTVLTQVARTAAFVLHRHFHPTNRGGAA